MGKLICLIQNVSILICFLYSLRLFKGGRLQPKYMGLFKYYAVTAFLFTSIGSYFYLQPGRYYEYSWITQSSVFFHFLFLSIVICEFCEIKSRHFNPRMFSIFSAILIIVVIPFDPLPGAGIAYFIANCALVALGISYFKSLYRVEKSLVLRSDPGYWIATGVTIGLGMTLPYLATIWYFKYNTASAYINPLVFVAVIGYVIMQVFFIKAMKCTAILN